MKKTLLAAATLSALMASGMANAAFTDADGSGGWTGNLEFNGAITNTNPAWKYQIPEATIAGAKDWNVKRSDGTVDGSNTNFSFSKDFTVLEGVMKAPAPVGGAGMQPIVTFGAGASAVVWDTAKQALTNSIISVDAMDKSEKAGVLSMSLTGEAASQNVSPPFPSNQVQGESVYANVPLALALLKKQAYYGATYDSYPKSNGSADAKGSGAASTGWLGPVPEGAFGGTKISAAIVVDASKFELSFPTASIPDAWTATLPISITVK